MNWNYDEFAEKLAMGRIDVDGAAMPFVLDEARKRRDGSVIAHVASWYEDVKDDKTRYLELAKEAAELGSPDANFWLGHECFSGENLPRDYEKAYSCFIKGEDVDWVPIEPEENADFGGVEKLKLLRKVCCWNLMATSDGGCLCWKSIRRGR